MCILICWIYSTLYWRYSHFVLCSIVYSIWNYIGRTYHDVLSHATFYDVWDVLFLTIINNTATNFAWYVSLYTHMYKFLWVYLVNVLLSSAKYKEGGDLYKCPLIFTYFGKHWYVFWPSIRFAVLFPWINFNVKMIGHLFSETVIRATKGSG